jgi:hypothetical protein
VHLVLWFCLNRVFVCLFVGVQILNVCKHMIPQISLLDTQHCIKELNLRDMVAPSTKPHVFAGVAVLIVVEHMNPLRVLDIAIGVSSTAMLLIILLCLGWGLVELPRYVWRCTPEYVVRWLAHR